MEVGKFPTRVHEIPKAALAFRIPGNLWIKREDEAGEPYGGNKVRKLRFMMEDWLRDGARSVIFVAPLGSNCAVALSSYAPRFGIVPFLVLVDLWDGNADMSATEKSDLCRSLGARVFLAHGIAEIPLKLAIAWKEAKALGKAFFVPPGASSPSSVLGYVMGAKELSYQVRSGLMPEPDLIFVPVGSGGTISGLALGCRLFGLKSKVIGISVARGPLAHPLRISMLIRSGYRELRKRWKDIEAESSDLYTIDFRISDDFIGEGYGIPTKEGERAIGILREKEGIVLDRSYTSKAFAGMVHILRKVGDRRTVALFLHTYSPMPWELA